MDIYIYICRHGPTPLCIVKELCESRGGRPGLSVLTSLLSGFRGCFGIGLSLSLISHLTIGTQPPTAPLRPRGQLGVKQVELTNEPLNFDEAERERERDTEREREFFAAGMHLLRTTLKRGHPLCLAAVKISTWATARNGEKGDDLSVACYLSLTSVRCVVYFLFKQYVQVYKPKHQLDRRGAIMLFFTAAAATALPARSDHHRLRQPAELPISVAAVQGGIKAESLILISF